VIENRLIELLDLFCKNNKKGFCPSVQAIVNLVDAYKEFSATPITERERDYVKMELTLHDITTDNALISRLKRKLAGLVKRQWICHLYGILSWVLEFNSLLDRIDVLIEFLAKGRSFFLT
jgi:hypothetical protein